MHGAVEVLFDRPPGLCYVLPVTIYLSVLPEVASHPAQSKRKVESGVRHSFPKSKRTHMTTTKNPIDIVFGVLVIVAGVLLSPMPPRAPLDVLCCLWN